MSAFSKVHSELIKSLEIWKNKWLKKECTLFKRVMIRSALNFWKWERKSECTHFFANEWELSEAQKINERWTRWKYSIFSHVFFLMHSKWILSNDYVLMCRKQCQSHLYPVTTMWHRSPSSSCVVSFSPLHKGAFTNYVDNIFPIIDHLPTPDDINEGIPCTVIGKSLHTVEISSTAPTYLLLSTYFVNDP